MNVKKSFEVIIPFLVGVFAANLVIFLLYRMALPLEEFIYVSF